MPASLGLERIKGNGVHGGDSIKFYHPFEKQFDNMSGTMGIFTTFDSVDSTFSD